MDQGAAKTKAAFTAWADLLAEGPAILQLSGGWTARQAAYENITFSRDSVVTACRTIAEYAEKAQSGDCCILHLGI